jgi:hypothetical protein
MRDYWDCFRLVSLGERNFLNALWNDFRISKIIPERIQKNNIFPPKAKRISMIVMIIVVLAQPHDAMEHIVQRRQRRA